MFRDIDRDELIKKLKIITELLIDGEDIVPVMFKLSELICNECSCEFKSDSNNYFLQSILDMIPVPVYYKDLHGVFILCNKALANLYGIEKPEIVGKTVFDIFNKEEADVFSSSDTVLIKEKSHEMVEHKGYFSALGDRFQIINKRVVLNDKKQAAGILGVIHDVTELKSRENSAWEGEAYYKLIYENSPVSAILFNSIYIIEEMNQAATEILSKPSVMIGHDISELFQNYSDFERVVGSENVPVKVKLIDGTEVSAITNTMYVGQSMRHSMIFIKADFIL